MTNKVRNSILVFLICILFLISCNQTELEKIEISWLPVADVEVQIDNYVKAGRIENAYFNEENILVFELTKRQRQKWLEIIDNDIRNYLSEANRIEELEMVMSNDSKELVIHADESVDFEMFGTYFLILSYNAELKQILEGTEDWELCVVVNDLETGEEIYRAMLPEETVKISSELWMKNDEKCQR